MTDRGLVDYLSSSEDSECESSCFRDVDVKPIYPVVKNEMPPPPSTFLDKFGVVDRVDDPSSHCGRVRSFKHETGNWATFVSINYPYDLSKVTNEVIWKLSDVCEFFPVDDLHLSLSRTVTILHHWIDPLFEDLKKQMFVSCCKRCKLSLSGVEIYCNDEKTRTFVGLKVTNVELFNYVGAVDSSFKQFQLPPFYKDPSFHVSLVWCIGDARLKLNPKLMDDITTVFCKFFSAHSDAKHFDATELTMKTGNRTLKLALLPSSEDDVRRK